IAADFMGICRKCPPVRRGRYAFLQHLQILFLRHLGGAELAQMFGYELRVEQGEAAMAQAGDEMDEGDLGGIACAMKHALAEERAAERHAVEAADQLSVLPHLDVMAVAEVEELPVERPDAPVDPGALAAWRRRGTARDDRFEISVD